MLSPIAIGMACNDLFAQNANNKISNKSKLPPSRLSVALPIASGEKSYFQNFMDSFNVDMVIRYFDNYYDVDMGIINDSYQVDILVTDYNHATHLLNHNKLAPLDYQLIANYRKPTSSVIGESRADESNYFASLARAYSVLGYNKNIFPNPPKSWSVIFDKIPKNGVVAWYDLDYNTLIRVAMQYLGYGFNTTNPKHLTIVAEFLKNHRKNVRFIATDTHKYIENKSANLTNSLTTSMLQIAKTNDHVGYIFPKEGIFQDEVVLVIPKSSKNIEMAHAFINYLNIPLVLKTLLENSYAGATHSHAKNLTGAQFQNNPFIYPKIDDVKIENVLYIDEQIMYNMAEIWKKLIL